MTTANPAADAFEIWRRALDEGTQAWLKALGQAPAAAPGPAAPDFGQFWRPILQQGLELWQRAAAQGQVSPEFMQQWKGFLDQWIDAWSRALGQAMATEGFAQALGRYLDQTLAAQAPVKKAMDQYTDSALKTLGLPSRSQVVGVARQLVDLEERIEGLEDRLDELKDLLRGPGPAAGRTADAAMSVESDRPARRRSGRSREAREDR
jgi:hypothetical protein